MKRVTVLAVVLGLVAGLVFAVWGISKLVDRRLDQGRIRTFAGFYARQRAALDEMTVPQLVQSLRIVWDGFPIDPLGRPEADSPLRADYERDRDAMIATLIDRLREKTGQDFGDSAEAWLTALKGL